MTGAEASGGRGSDSRPTGPASAAAGGGTTRRPAGLHVFEYATLRVVPRVERGESINAGVIVYCQGLDFLGAAIHLDEQRLRALDPSADVASVRAALAAFDTVCDGTSDAAPCEPPPGQRFRWLTAPRSTIVQPSPVHAGLTADPRAELAHLLDILVR